METELENYKKSITKEQEKNEQLTLLLKKIDADTTHVKKQMELIASKIEALQSDYTTYTRALQETEQALTVVSGVSACVKHVPLALKGQTDWLPCVSATCQIMYCSVLYMYSYILLCMFAL